MAATAFNLITQAFAAVADWFTDIVTAVDGAGIIATCFLIYAVVALLVMPLRGAAIGAISDFTKNSVSKKSSSKSSKKG